jgi:hypothetical protein
MLAVQGGSRVIRSRSDKRPTDPWPVKEPSPVSPLERIRSELYEFKLLLSKQCIMPLSGHFVSIMLTDALKPRLCTGWLRSSADSRYWTDSCTAPYGQGRSNGFGRQLARWFVEWCMVLAGNDPPPRRLAADLHNAASLYDVFSCFSPGETRGSHHFLGLYLVLVKPS